MPDYQVGSQVWINRSLFKDAYAKSQEKDKLTARRFGPFIVKELIGRNALRLELPNHFKIHSVVHVSHTTPHRDQPTDIAATIPTRPAPLPTIEGNEYEVEAILKHRKIGRGYQFLTLWKGYPNHDATWQKTSDFIDSRENKNSIWQEYLRDKGILTQHQ